MAYELAVQRNDTQHIEKFGRVIEVGLKKIDLMAGWESTDEQVYP